MDELVKLDIKQMTIHQEVVQTDKFKINFTDNWPIAKVCLLALKSAFKNPFVRWAINAVINLGDQLFGEVTPE